MPAYNEAVLRQAGCAPAETLCESCGESAVVEQ
jgi:hypothetical protein